MIPVLIIRVAGYKTPDASYRLCEDSIWTNSQKSGLSNILSRQLPVYKKKQITAKSYSSTTDRVCVCVCECVCQISNYHTTSFITASLQSFVWTEKRQVGRQVTWSRLPFLVTIVRLLPSCKCGITVNSLFNPPVGSQGTLVPQEVLIVVEPFSVRG